MATCKNPLSKLSAMEAGSGGEGPAAWRPPAAHTFSMIFAPLRARTKNTERWRGGYQACLLYIYIYTRFAYGALRRL